MLIIHEYPHSTNHSAILQMTMPMPLQPPSPLLSLSPRLSISSSLADPQHIKSICKTQNQIYTHPYRFVCLTFRHMKKTHLYLYRQTHCDGMEEHRAQLTHPNLAYKQSAQYVRNTQHKTIIIRCVWLKRWNEECVLRRSYLVEIPHFGCGGLSYPVLPWSTRRDVGVCQYWSCTSFSLWVCNASSAVEWIFLIRTPFNIIGAYVVTHSCNSNSRVVLGTVERRGVCRGGTT